MSRTSPRKARLGMRASHGVTPLLRPGGWENWLWGLLLAAATILVYQQAWNAGFIWDDDKYVTENPLLTAPDGLKRIWFSLDSPSQYFPLVYTTFRLEHALWGLNPAGYHWVNILLHAANALLVWRSCACLRVPGAWLAAALFALHPVNVESVAWITERKNVLMGLFFLLALSPGLGLSRSAQTGRVEILRPRAAALCAVALQQDNRLHDACSVVADVLAQRHADQRSPACTGRAVFGARHRRWACSPSGGSAISRGHRASFSRGLTERAW